ncbi:hypothetical protein [uncultured Shimia sp.]|uniref:hypothetical protein n=1 Tax=uncultured Shimia sp. TaxID=573152 RepID=UPI0026275875|nr:hypothetical protein [uncultured Shimia sp.]
MSYLQTRFPALYNRIEASRKRNATLSEICNDLEALSEIYAQRGAELDLQARQDMMDSIRGLENEISAIFEPYSPKRHSKEEAK